MFGKRSNFSQMKHENYKTLGKGSTSFSVHTLSQSTLDLENDFCIEPVGLDDLHHACTYDIDVR